MAAKKTSKATKKAKKTAKKAPAKKAAKKATKKAAKKTGTKKPAAKTAKKTAKKAAKKTAKKAAKKTAKKAAKKTAKKAAKKATNKALTVDAVSSWSADAEASHTPTALPARMLAVPPSYAAAATLIPDGEDALGEAMGEAFDALFDGAGADTAAEPAQPAAPFEPGEPSLDLAQTCAALALDKKADDVVILQVEKLTSYADYFVIAAASSERQAQAVARTISDELRACGRQPLSTDGLEQGNWVVLDYGAVVVHVFMAGARAYYDLDGFWADAPRVDIDEARGMAHLEHLAR